jgi:hypothetical protein
MQLHWGDLFIFFKIRQIQVISALLLFGGCWQNVPKSYDGFAELVVSIWGL